MQHPELRIIPLNQLIAHEKFDFQRLEPLIVNIKNDGVLKNPPLVTPLNDANQRFVVLDGANRVSALAELGIEFALVQVVDYESDLVQLLTWYHVISGAKRQDIIEHLQGVEDLEVEFSELVHARAELARHNIVSFAIFANGDVITLTGKHTDLRSRNELLHRVVDGYIQKGRLDRTNTDNLTQILSAYPNLTVAFIFPQYTPAEILDLTQEGLAIPPGLTRHLVQGRALRLNYPLNLLSDGRSVEEKNRELGAWIQEGFKTRKIRYYAESVFMFDE